MDDYELLQAYARRQAEDAFATLVRRYVNLVFSAALRQTGNSETAADVTQVVFILLARKSGVLGKSVIIPGWLLRTTHYTAINARRRDQRRQEIERKSMEDCNPAEAQARSTWEQIAPLLDHALVRLKEKDRNAIVLRYFEQKSFREVGEAMGLSENTARMRVTRALERLRIFFARHGVAVSSVMLVAAISVGAVQAGPPGMTASVTAAAMAKGAGVVGLAGTLLKTALDLLAWSKVKTAAFIGIPLLLLIGTGTYVGHLAWARAPAPNVLQNGDFERGLEHWRAIIWNQQGVHAKVIAEQSPDNKGQLMRVSVTQPGGHDSIELVQTPVSLQAGHKYAVSFLARSTATQPLRVMVNQNKAPWTFYGLRVSTEITPRWKRYRLSGRALVTADDGRFIFHCGGTVGDIWIDDVKLQDRGL